MSFFSKTEIKELRSGNERIIRIAVSNVAINPTIAITTSNKIHLFNESGDKHQYELSRSITPTCIEWHPFHPILAIGWDNGRITIWNEDTKAPKEEGKPHADPIMMIKFNPSGSRMVTSDLTGTIGVWRGINLLAVYQKEWAITHCVFCELSIEGVKGNLGNLFLFAGRSGTVCLANDMNMCSDVCRVGGTIKALMFYQKEGSAIVITSNLLLVQFRINFTEKSVPEKKMKLSISGEPENLSSIWIGESLLSTCSNENMIRFWHLETDENYNLTVFDVLNADSLGINMGGDKISSIVYDNRGRSLVAGTREGRLLFWKNMALGTDSPVDKDQWNPQPILELGRQIQTLTVGKNNGVIILKQSDGDVIIVSETKISAKISGHFKAILKGTDKIELTYEDSKDKFVEQFNTSGHIKGFDIMANKLLYWTNKKIEIMEASRSSQLTVAVVSTLEQKALRCLFASQDSFIISTDYGFNLLALNGQVKQTLTFPESEGKVSGIEINHQHLVCWTSESYLRIFHMGADIKQVGSSRRFEDSRALIGNIKSCAINANGKKVGIISHLAKSSGSTVNHSFHIYDSEADSFVGYDLGSDHIPVTFYWDKKEVRYFGVQVESSRNDLSKPEEAREEDESEEEEDTEQEDAPEEEARGSSREFLTFFYTQETGIRAQDKFVLRGSTIDIFALKIPHFYSVDRVRQNYQIKKTTLHDFQRINYEDDIIKNSILNFSFHLTAGNLDEAYKSVKNIQNSAIWEKMAIMCVKCKRLDVAEICIGNMKFARGARSIRQAKKEPEVDTQLAMVAIQLGMLDEAKAFYERSQRYDLYSRVCQSNSEVERAIEVSEKYDRINLKNTYYNAAKLYEASNNFELAVKHYELSNTHHKEVPRMFMEAGKIRELTEYVDSKRDKKLYTWLGQYNESVGNLEEAVRYYEEGESTSNLVRLYLSQEQVQESIKICNSDSEPQACFLLARHLEKAGMLSEAIHFYAKAQYYSQAVKIAINNELDGEIMGLSMQAPREVAFRSASYFERKGLVEKAIRLFHKAAAFKKGNALAEKHGFTELITHEAPDEDSGDDQEVVLGGDGEAANAKVAALLEAGKYERAVPLLVGLKQFDKALDLCLAHNVPLQEEHIKKMVPDEDPGTPGERHKKQERTKAVAEILRKQGSFEMASNLYIRTGDKLTSLKCLIEWGDAGKVVAFANMARSSETYILAANFLQTADWHQNPELMKNIITFYQKAKAFENLSSFFEACSNVEIDEYRDYDKAGAALKEALKYMGKSASPDRQFKLEQIGRKRELIQKFVELKDLAESEPQEMVRGCQALLQEIEIDQAVRRGDLFAIIIEYYFETGEYQRCFDSLKEMKERGIIIAPYVDREIIDTVYKQLGIATKKKDEVEEEVIEDIS